MINILHINDGFCPHCAADASVGQTHWPSCLLFGHPLVWLPGWATSVTAIAVITTTNQDVEVYSASSVENALEYAKKQVAYLEEESEEDECEPYIWLIHDSLGYRKATVAIRAI